MLDNYYHHQLFPVHEDDPESVHSPHQQPPQDEQERGHPSYQQPPQGQADLLDHNNGSNDDTQVLDEEI